MQSADLVIAGASFSGLTCAAAAATRGVKTVVLERKPSAGATPRTTGILVKEVADAWDVPRRLTRAIHGVRVYSPSLRWIDLVSPGYYFLATDTPGVMNWLAQVALDAGAQIRFSRPYVGAVRAGRELHLAGHDLACRQLVGCDGAKSRVATDFSLGRNTSYLIGVEAEFENVPGLEADRLHVFLDSDLARGYIGWIVPGCGITQIGLATRHPRRPRLDDFLAKIGPRFRLGDARRVGMRTGRIPCGGIVKPWSVNGVMLLGDAAGMVSPVTAGGIHSAIQLGRTAGVALADQLLENGTDATVAVKRLLPSFFFKRLLRTAFDCGPPNSLYDRLLDSRLFQNFAGTVFFHHRGLFSWSAWRELLSGLG